LKKKQDLSNHTLSEHLLGSNMASGTGTSEANTAIDGVGEDEPLLGRPGDASQQEGFPLFYNLIIGK
jgi:hypothetical protein